VLPSPCCLEADVRAADCYAAVVNAASLAALVRKEIEDFQVPEPHPMQLGLPLPPEWFAGQLAEMRSALVEPYCIEMPNGGGARPVWVVAEDMHVLLAYDAEGDFVLIFRDAPEPGLSPVRGDAVGCFMAR
jgi:hypothetical protein